MDVGAADAQGTGGGREDGSGLGSAGVLPAAGPWGILLRAPHLRLVRRGSPGFLSRG